MSGDKSLAYKNEFKNEIKKHEGILRDAKLMIDELSDRSKYQKTLENENILVEYKGRHPDGTSDRKYFKVSIKDGGTEYFVKRINRRGRIDRNVNYSVTDEMMEMDQLKDDVVGVKGVRVLEYKMAYNDADMGYCIAHYDPVLEKTYDERIADGTLSPNQMTAKYFKMMSDVTEASVAHAR